MPQLKPKTSIEQQIDDNLRRVYRATESEALPDKFLSLIAQLKATPEAPRDDS